MIGPGALGELATGVGGRVLDRLWGRRRRREALLGAALRLDAFLQSMSFPIANAAVRRIPLPTEAGEWTRLVADVTGRALADPDRSTRLLGEELRDLVEPMAKLFHAPYELEAFAQAIQEGDSRSAGPVLSEMIARVTYLLMPRWRRLLHRSHQ